MNNPYLICGCCKFGCMCAEHSTVRDMRGPVAITCEYHKIQNDLDDAMRRAFVARVRQDSGEKL